MINAAYPPFFPCAGSSRLSRRREDVERRNSFRPNTRWPKHSILGNTPIGGRESCTFPSSVEDHPEK
jgi:hypothetical protein